MGKSLYLTTTLPYVNADPHIGFALELVQADIIARYRALLGDEVFFSTGTDEHGLKIYRKAKEEGKDPQAYVDEYAAKFHKLKEKLGLSPELHFIRTTNPHHVAAAQELWRRCEAKGDIYKKKYKGLYCVGDEAFLKEGDLVDGKCPNHPSMEPIEIEEENYFFRLGRYGERLREYLSRADAVIPDWRRQEALQFVERGLEDFSISRVADKMPWGVPVPGDDTQVMYVWFDALTNYISTLGWPEDAEGNFKKYWEGGDTLQLAGKDQVRFQSIMWQAMLMSAGLPVTKHVFYHGFITSGGQKMSKSLGNVIDPLAIVDEYGADALRYFLARHVHPFDDSDFTMERFKDAYNADLANGLGNLAARVMTMSAKYMSNPVDVPGATESDPEVGMRMEHFEFNQALERTLERIGHNDALIALKKPFSAVNSDDVDTRQEALSIIAKLVRELYAIATEIEPVMPGTAEHIKKAVLNNKKPENLFPRKE
ncbi:methionine--tRNA ligase [Candidatus Kaiserbacteria bacterium]|nr:methionine--tRNA ligase [Candidatus Kaiserbacteria bacterium]